MSAPRPKATLIKERQGSASAASKLLVKKEAPKELKSIAGRMLRRFGLLRLAKDATVAQRISNEIEKDSDDLRRAAASLRRRR